MYFKSLPWFGSILLIACASAGCSSGPRRVEPSPEELRRSLDLDLRSFSEAVNAGDSERFAALYAEECLDVPAKRPELLGRDQVRSYYQDFFSQLKPELIQYDPDPRFNGNWVIVHEKWTLLVHPQGSDSVEVEGQTLWYGQRAENGHWERVWSLSRFEHVPEDLVW